MPIARFLKRHELARRCFISHGHLQLKSVQREAQNWKMNSFAKGGIQKHFETKNVKLQSSSRFVIYSYLHMNQHDEGTRQELTG